MSYSSEVLADSPLAYWRLGDAAGTTAADSSGNGHTASCDATPVTGLLVGDSDQARAGAGNASASAWMNVTAITVECWIKPSATNNNRGVLARFQGGANDWILWCDTNSKIAWRPYNTSGSSTDIAWSTTPTTGNIYHVVATYQSGQTRLYINGSQVAQTTALTGNLQNNAANLEMASYSASNVFSGTIDEVAIYSGELSAARIAAHYAAGTGAQTIALGQATETDSAQSIANTSQSIALAQATSTMSAQALTVVIGAAAVAVGRATEADSAQALTVASPITVALNRASETDSASDFVVISSGALAQATEADSAQTLTVVPGATAVALGQADETDEAQALAVQQPQTVALGQAEETDSASPLLVAGAPQTVTVGRATVAMSAQTFTVVTYARSSTDEANRGNGRHRSGYGTLVATAPLAATPATKEPIRVMAQSVPMQNMSGGQPV